MTSIRPVDLRSGPSRPRSSSTVMGKEVYRHVGFMDENAIVEQFTKMGVKG
jgi:hypothetical protein